MFDFCNSHTGFWLFLQLLWNMISIQIKSEEWYKITMKLLLDTDIGSDIDDAACLTYLLMQPDL